MILQKVKLYCTPLLSFTNRLSIVEGYWMGFMTTSGLDLSTYESHSDSVRDGGMIYAH